MSCNGQSTLIVRTCLASTAHLTSLCLFYVDKQGISKRFVSYFQSLDSSLGSRVVGPEKTISGKVQDTLTGAQAKAKEVDEQKGFSKTATDVRFTF